MKLIKPNHLSITPVEHHTFDYYICDGWRGDIINNQLVIPSNGDFLYITEHLRKFNIPFKFKSSSIKIKTYEFIDCIMVDMRYVKIV